MGYYLAVDAGGTKAEFLLAEDGRELARALTGTIKRVNADAGDAEENLENALAELERLTGVRRSRVTATCIGTSGDTVPLVTDWLRQSFSERVSGSLRIVCDVEIALDAAFQGGRGVLVLAGTGSNVAARDARGNILTAGGWGPMLADQGSGHWIGMEALRKGFLARDEGRPTELLERACRLWNLPAQDALIEFANTQPPQRYASQMAPEVAACAAQGDPVAIEILERGGADLAHLAGLLIDRMRRTEQADLETPAVAIAGSILANVERVRAALKRDLQSRYADLRWIDEPVDPVRGALWHAMRGV
ncbi:MAG TPA: BadF/BadG/BcrA/BcrD ATPase family protein [Terracidiphilus sp.]|jgi:N-acetylglucosamine kinase-like BadF-type ATPase|nr:BadF/BadG/BcrA/BcrD ATPase family protein [Terracidiphilus sp.]